MAEEAVQEAFATALQRIGDFRGEARIGTWLHRIVFNACLDELGRLRRVDAVPLEDAPETLAPGPDHADRLAGREQLEDALASLPPHDRAAVLLVDGQGFDYAAAAEVLGIPAGTVASRLNRARATLRRALGESVKGVAQ